MKQILALNSISPLAEKALGEDFCICEDAASPVAVLVRSADMHSYDLASTVLCVGRAGAGTNNIPIERYTRQGVVVFNTPGANANAVKELVLCALLLGSRRIFEGITWAQGLKGNPDAAKLVEKGKGQFVGRELFGKSIGIVGLGAIGAQVANTCLALGMTVFGYDPFISIDRAWTLDNRIQKETDLNRLLANCDYVSLHLPLTKDTRGMLDAHTLSLMPKDAVIINCSRAELVDSGALLGALERGELGRYVTDFPTPELCGVPNVITIPHLGASTPEAEDNCAVMATRQIVDFVRDGNITNSVNLPQISIPRSGKCRITLVHANVKGVLNKVTELVSDQGFNIENMASRAQGEFAYALLDVDEVISDTLADQIAKLDNIVRVRVL